MAPGHDDGTECQKTRDTNPGTLPETKKTEDMMMEQNARIPRTKNQGGTKLFLGRVENPIQLQSCLGNKPRNPSRSQARMMEQSARRVGRQAPEPQPERGNDDGTGCQKDRGTSPETPPEPGHDDGRGCQKSRETSPGTLAGTRT